MIHRSPFISVSLLLFAVLLLGQRPSTGEEMMVFISAFAPGEEGAIHAYHLDTASGELTLLHRNTDVEHPFFMALSPSGRFLYSIHAPGEFGGPEEEQVAAFEVLGDSGELKLLNRQSARGSAACYLDVDAKGRTLTLANYATGSVAAFPIRTDGSLAETSSFMPLSGSSIRPERQSEPHTHCAVVSPDNRFVLAADLGLDKILTFRLDADSSQLTAHRQSFVRTPPGAGPRHLTFHPNGQHVYVINELENSVTHFAYDVSAGLLFERETLSTLPKDYAGTSYCADVKITPNGRFLYGTNRGHDSLAAYRIAEDGSLTLQVIVPSGGEGPQNLAITPRGDLLLCANMPGNNVIVFRIEPDSGGLVRVGKPMSMPGPSCILLP